MPAQQPHLIPGDFSPLTLVVMFVILAASAWVFVELVRRDTRHRRRHLLIQWARTLHLRLLDPADAPGAGAALAPLKSLNPKIDFLIHGQVLTIVQVRIDNASASAATAVPRWNLLLRRIDESWPLTALRPTAHTSSIVDLFSLSSYPSLTSAERFVVFGTDPSAARALTESPARSLLPADIGLVFNGPCLILDFTCRPFDQIEFGRMIDLSNQLAARVHRRVAASAGI